jgi:3-hydroxyisobutyrate dehydrogenase-like beta-hydroxyacid dehydrogenase
MGVVGFVGLGNMGSVLASNLVATGHDVVANDVLGPARARAGASYASTVAEVAGCTDVVVLSLPDGAASEAVVGEIVDTGERRTTHVVDTSTIGVPTARALGELLAAHGIAYVDAPVSGGVAGLSDRHHRVGDRPGMAQAMKLANNFLSATTLAATSEAIAFGVSEGLDMATMLEVLNGASGRSVATSEKFPDHVLTGRYAAGFTNSLMAKDVELYVRAVEARGGALAIGAATARVWGRFAAAEPGADFTRIYPFVGGS